MLKYYTCLLSALCFLHAHAQTPAQVSEALAQLKTLRQSSVQTFKTASVKQLDSIHEFSWEVDDWTMAGRILNTHNAGQQIIESVILTPELGGGPGWDNSTRTQYTYTAFDSIEIEEIAGWDGLNSTWAPADRRRRVYNANHRPDSNLVQSWSADNAAWITESYIANTWTAFDSLASSTEVWIDITTGAISGGNRLTNYYSPGHQLDSTLHENWDEMADDWVVSALDMYHYNLSGRVDTITSFEPGADSGTWTLAGVSLMAYDGAGRILSIITQSDLGGGMEDFLQISFVYDANGWMEKETFQFKDFVGTGWLILSETTYTYDADGHVVEETIAGMDPFGGGTTLENQTRNHNFWNELNSSNDPAAGAVKILVANPARAGSTMRFEGLSGPAVLTISDIEGRIVASRQISGSETTLPMTLRTGLYQMQLTSGQASAATEKVLVLE